MTAPKPDDLSDPRLDAAWRDASREEPSAALDEAIRAAARREVGAGPVAAGSETHVVRGRGATPAAHVPEATRPERWWWPLAAAATIGAIAFGLLQLKPVENGGPSVVSDMPAPPTTPAPPPVTRTVPAAPTATGNAQAPPPRVSSETRATPPAAVASSARKAMADTPSAFPAAETPPPPRGEPAALAKVEKAGGSAERVRETAGEQATEAPVAAPASKLEVRQEAARQDAAPQGVAPHDATLPVAEWIAKIRRLRDEGKSDEAAKELAAFRAAYPDHEQRLPPDLRNWRVPAK